jgi:hypothetical protein
MSRSKLLRVLAVSALLVLAACGGSAGSSADMAAPQRSGPAGGSLPGAAEDAGGDAALADNALALVGLRIIKDGSISVEVADDKFDKAYRDASLVAPRHGGYLGGSTRGGSEPRTATIVLRVPSEEFEAALDDVRALGKVTSEESSAEDVTAQFVDLESRVRNWKAQERVLLGLMDRATSIDESITVQRRLQDVQLTIERLEGQLRVLRDQTDLATINVELSEPGAKPAAAGSKGTLSRAIHEAVTGFVSVVAAVVVAVGYVVPLALFALIGWAIYRRTRPKLTPAES